jgi:hypothetical protein
MRLRDISGEINRATTVYVWVWLAFVDDPDKDDVGTHVAVEKKTAREIVAFAREHGLTELEAHTDKGNLYLDEPADLDDADGSGEFEVVE